MDEEENLTPQLTQEQATRRRTIDLRQLSRDVAEEEEGRVRVVGWGTHDDDDSDDDWM